MGQLNDKNGVFFSTLLHILPTKYLSGKYLKIDSSFEIKISLRYNTVTLKSPQRKTQEAGKKFVNNQLLSKTQQFFFIVQLLFQCRN